MLLIPEATFHVASLPFSIIIAHTAAHHAAAARLCSSTYFQGRRLVALCKKSSRALGVAVVCSNLDYPIRLPWEVPSCPPLNAGFAYVDSWEIAPDAQASVIPAMLKAIWLWTVGRGAASIVACAAPDQQAWYRPLGLRQLSSSPVPSDGRVLLEGSVYQANLALMAQYPSLYSFFYEQQHPDIRLVRGCAPTTG